MRTIHVANLTKQFGDTIAVRDVNFSINKGEVVGFVGPNGAGKTTTIAMLLGFMKPHKGSVKLLDKYVITPETAHLAHKHIGYVAGDITLFDGMTGQQYLQFMGHRFGVDATVRKRLDDKLSPQLDKRLKHLSRGNKQKISLIAALQHDPDLIIMDEPTSGLDPLMQETFLSIIREEAHRGATVFMSSHILSEVARACSRIIFMKNGRIMTDKPLKEIESNAGKLIRLSGADDQIKALLASLPGDAKIISQSKTHLELRYDDVHAALRWLNTKSFDDISIEDRQLDYLFIDLYKDEETTPA